MKNYLIFAFASTLTLMGCAKPAENSHDLSQNLSIVSAQMAPAKNPHSKGMVVAANPHAVKAGVEALRAGGSAVDAAIAVQTVLGLVEPQSSGIAGGAFMIFYDAKSGKVTAYNGRETAPAASDETLFMDAEGEPIRRFDGVVSGLSTGVPGVMAMLDMAHKDHGKLAWKDGFNAAIKLSEDGFAVSPRMAGLVATFSKYGIKEQTASRAYFMHKDGTPIEVGFIRDNKPYAAS